MPDYSQSKLYKVEPFVEHPDSDIYIGSTTLKYLCDRMGYHRKNYKCYQNGKYHNISVFGLFDKYGVDNCKIYLLENVNAKDKHELTALEGQYIRSMPCVNKRIEGRTRDEYLKQYLAIHKEEIKEKRNVYLNNNSALVECPCGSCVVQYSMYNHIKTEKHKKYLKTII